MHLKRIVANVKLTYEEFTTVLAQIEACLSSRPLVPLNVADNDGIQALTPGHFLIGQPLMALPDPFFFLPILIVAAPLALVPESGAPLLAKMVWGIPYCSQ